MTSLIHTDPIWGQLLAEVRPWDYGGCKANSSRIGGRCAIPAPILSKIQALSPAEKARLTRWILDRNRFTEDEWPLIEGSVLEQIQSQRALPVVQKLDKILEYLAYIGHPPGAIVPWRSSSLSQGEANVRAMQEVSAWAECQSESEFHGLTGLLLEQGYLIYDNSTHRVTISASGYERINALMTSALLGSQAFIAMWFDPSTDEAYNKGFYPAVERAGYRGLRIDKKEHSNKIDDEIITEIRRSRFLIADFTCMQLKINDDIQHLARGGVYYEAGFAQGLGIPVIWTVRSDQISNVHFDTRQYNHITWNSPSDLEEKLYNRIGAWIGLGAEVN